MAKKYPVVWSPYMQAAMIQHQTLISAGLVNIDPSPPVVDGGQYFVKPIQDNIDSIASPVKVTSSTTITPTTLSDYSENVIVAHIGDGYYGTNYNNLVRGAPDTIEHARSSLAELVNKWHEKYLISAIKGAFTTTLKTSHSYDWTGIGDGYFSHNAVLETLQNIYGENKDQVRAMVVHSAIKRDMELSGAVKEALSVSVNDRSQFVGTTDTYNGWTLLTNDTMCEPTTTNGITKYPVYFMKGTPLYLGYQNSLSAYTDFVAKTGGGRNEFYWYSSFAPHIEYLSFNTAKTDPSKSDLETGSNWSKISLDEVNKHIGISRILVKAREEYNA